MVLLTLLVCLLIPSFARAATIPVAAGQSIQDAVNRAQPGDTVQVGPGTFRQRIDLNGANERLVKVQGTPGKTILDGSGMGNGWMIYGRHVKNMTVSHFEIRNHTGGGIGLFGDSVNVAITDNYVHDNSFVCCQGSGIRVTSKFDPTTNRQQGVGVVGTAHHITIARNTIKNLTTGFTGQLATNGTESLTVAGDVSHFLIEDNVIDRGQFIGIDLIGKSAAWWGQIPGQRPTPAEPWPRQGIVRRNTITNLKTGMGGGDVGIYCDGCRDIVIEHNRVDGSSGYCYNVSTEEDGFRTEQVILRHNVGINCTSAPFGIGPASSQAHPDRHGEGSHFRVVHNTAIRTKPGGPLFRFQYAGDTQAKNNIGVNVGDTPTPYVWHGVPDASAAPQLDHNLYWGGNNYFEHRGRASLSLSEHQTRSGQETHSRLADPHLTNVAGRDFSTQAGSPALNQGTPLTQTAGAGSGTVVTVEDARYFSDGYGMVAGDQVQIGSQTARITHVDYTTNRLTLDRPLTWTHGQAVSYPYTGSAPDLGACEGVGTCGPSQAVSPVSPPATLPTTPSPTPGPPQAACTHYASPSGGGNGSSPTSAFHIADFWGGARPGHVLCLLDGTYTGGDSMIQVPSSFAGTASQPITIRALHDGKVLINGQDGLRPVQLRGSWGILEGINATLGDNANIVMSGNDWVARRVGTWNGGRGESHLIEMAGNRNTLEDFFAFGTAEKVFAAGSVAKRPTGNTVRRGWIRGGNAVGVPLGHTEIFEIGYGQDNVLAENVLVTLHQEGPPPGAANDAHLNVFRTHNSRLFGSISYMMTGSPMGRASWLVNTGTDGGSDFNPGNSFHPTTGLRMKEVVAIIQPGHARFGSTTGYVFGYSSKKGTAPHGSNNLVDKIVAVAGGRSLFTPSDYTVTNYRYGTTVAAALSGSGHSSMWTYMEGLCKRYVNGVVTTQGLWPWPMNQRILEATTLSGPRAENVTASMETLFGPIPPQCRGEGGSSEPPAVAALPAPRELRILRGP